MATSVSTLMNLIINQHFLDLRCIFVFLAKGFTNFEYTSNVPLVILQGRIHQDILFRYHGCQGFIIHNENPVSTFSEIEAYIRLSVERFNFRKYLVMPLETCEDCEDVMDIFKMVELTYVSNILVVTQMNGTEGNESYQLLTHKFVGKTDNNLAVDLDTWFASNESFLWQADLFPDKIRDQKGRILRMACFNYEPYVIYENSTNGYYGSELSMAYQFANYLNTEPVLVVNEFGFWGTIFNNWTGKGLLGNLASNKADIGFAALYTWDRFYPFLDMSKPLVRTGVTCLVPAPKLATGWLTPTLSYSYELWIAFGIAILFGIFDLYFMLNTYSSQNKVFPLYVMDHSTKIELLDRCIGCIGQLMLLQPISRRYIPNYIPIRMLFLLLFLLSLLFSSTYSSGLASIMTIPRYERAIDNVEDLANSDLKWTSNSDAWLISLQTAEEEVYKTMMRRFEVNQLDYLRKLSMGDSYAYPIERLPYGSFAIGSFMKKDIIENYHLMQQDIYWEQCLVYARKSSVLLPILDKFILRVYEAGLIARWQSDAVHLFMDAPVQQAVKYYGRHGKNRKIVKLNILHIQGALGILVLGYIISSLIFLTEIFWIGTTALDVK